MALDYSGAEIVGSDRFGIGLDVGSKHGIETHKSNPAALRSRSPGFR